MTRPRKLPTEVVCPMHGGSHRVERVAVAPHDDGTWHIYAFAFCPKDKTGRHEIAGYIRKSETAGDHALRGDEPESASEVHRAAGAGAPPPATSAGVHEGRHRGDDPDEF